MSEYIKTGVEIECKILSLDNSADKESLQQKKWVSLDWLKEQLVLLDIKLSSASQLAIPLSVDGKKEMHRGFITYNEVADMIRELKHSLEG